MKGGGHLGTVLLDEGLIEEDALSRAIEMAEEKDHPLGRVLVDDGFLPEADLVRALARHIGMEFVDLVEVTVDPAAASLIPDALARRYGALPIGFEGERLVIAMADPGNVLAVDDIRAITGREIITRVATRTDIENALSRLAGLDDSVTDLTEMASDGELESLTAIESAADEAPVIKLVNTLISRAAADRASDIHIEPNEIDLLIRYRIDGVLHELMRTPRSIARAVVSRIKIMADIDIAERRRPQDGRISMRIADKAIDLRVSTLPTIYGEKVVMRILDNSTAMLTLADLGFLPDTAERYASSYNKPYGTILVVGPTGSGKSTTLYATLNVINRPEVNIVTVEDPVEYRLAGINQVQVNPKAGLEFANALRSFLRQDPDIMLVGEIRDLETAKIAIESALTGHLVLSTLHTNDAPSSISRLVEMGIEPFLAGSAVDAILAQRLARRLCSSCKDSFEPTPDTLREVGWDMEELGGEIPTLYRPKGCAKCSGTGYKGRLALHELMLVTGEVERMAIEKATTNDIAKAARHAGMRPLKQDGLIKVAKGLTSIDEILRVLV